MPCVPSRLRATLAVASSLALASCEGTEPRPGLPPGLVVVTTSVAAPAGGRAAVVVRTERPARVSLLAGEDRLPLAAGRTAEEATSLVFAVPPWVSPGSTVELEVVALTPDGVVETGAVVLRGVSDVTRRELAGGPFLAVAGLESTAMLLATGAVHAVGEAGAIAEASPRRRPICLAADPGADRVLVAGDGDEVWSYRLDALALEDSFALPVYDTVPPQAVGQVRSLHVLGALVGAGTDRGMSIVDRSAGVDEEGNYCRGRSAMTTVLVDTDFSEAMEGVAVTATERLFAVGGYLNVNQAFEGGDDRTCEDPMPGRGTRVLDVPGEGSAAWGGAAMALSGASLWLARLGEILSFPSDVEPEANRRIPAAALTSFPSETLPLPSVRDLAPAPGGGVWAVLQDSLQSRGGLARIALDGSLLWVDMASIGDLPVAVDSTPLGRVWVATPNGYAFFDDPG